MRHEINYKMAEANTGFSKKLFTPGAFERRCRKVVQVVNEWAARLPDGCMDLDDGWMDGFR